MGTKQPTLLVLPARNCLNAGLWEVVLSTNEGGEKKLYYHGWFTFPLGQYKRIWEQNTDRSYWCDDLLWYRMEHWLDPAGTKVDLAKLRTVCSAQCVPVHFNPCEAILADGEQKKKSKTTRIPHRRTWGDLIRNRSATFATFRPPGLYDWKIPRPNEFWRIACLRGGKIRRVRSPLRCEQLLHEIEIVYDPDETMEQTHGYGQTRRRGDLRQKKRYHPATRVVIGGVNLNELPVLPVCNYSKGFYMPMGISVPPFHQQYRDLQNEPPRCSPYYSFILDEYDRWIDHHKLAVDGPVMHRDEHDPDLVHVYLLSYERHSLVAHYVLPIPRDVSATTPAAEEGVSAVPE